MNNFRYMARKWHRDTLERNIIYNLKSTYPGLEQHISSHRYPVLPKIVLYSNAASSQSFLRNIFPFYSLLTPSPTAQSDEVITRRIAESLTKVEEGAEGSKFGNILRGFPFNTNQALLLDRYLNGVNLAIHLKSPTESTEYESSIKPLLDYYDERGSLLELTHSGESNLAEIEEAFQKIRINIKRSA